MREDPGSGRQRRPRRTPTERRATNAAVDDAAVVLEAALRYLEARQRSVAEVRRRLLQRGYRSDLVDDVVERLGALGILDDAAFASAWVASRDRAHPRGERALRRELWLKGLSDNDITDALDMRRTRAGADDPDSDDADGEAARRLLEKNGAALARVTDPILRRRRGYALLARHGFDPDTAARAARRLQDAGSELAGDEAGG